MGEAHFVTEIHHAAGRMAGAMQDVEGQRADRDPIALIEPAVRREIAHARDAEPRAAGHHIVEQEFVGDVGAFDRHLQRVAQLGGAANMVDVAVGQPDLLDPDIGLLDCRLNFRNVAAGVDHNGLPGGFAPDQGAVLLKQRHRDDDSAGFCLGFGFLGHVSTMPVFCAPPRARLKHFDRDWIARGSRLGLGQHQSWYYTKLEPLAGVATCNGGWVPLSRERLVENAPPDYRTICAFWVAAESDRLWFNGIARPPGKPRASAGSPSVGDGAGDRARHRAAIAVAGIFLRQRIAAALGAACRPGGAERARRDLDRRDQIIDRGFARRPEVAGLPGALRPAVLRLHPGPAVRDFSDGNRADRRRRLWRAYALRGAGASSAGAYAQADDGAFRDRRRASDQSAGRCGRPGWG